MIRLLAILLALALPAWAQTATTTSSTQLNFPPCPAPNYYSSADGKSFSCTTAPAAGSSLTAGAGIAIVNGAISTSFPVISLAAARPIVSTDGAHTLSYTGAVPGIFTLPASGSPGFANGWALCLYVHGAGPLTLASTSAFYGGPPVMNQGQAQCVQADDGGGWLLSGAPAIVLNPNPILR